MHDYWHKQTNKPLFPDLLWSRPENRQHAGKLLIIGGNLYGFAAPAEAYQAAMQSGLGVGRVLLPDALQKTVGFALDTSAFAPSTPSGSFSQKALAEWLSFSAWADGVLLAGDLGRNSETAIVLEKCIETYAGQLTLTKDAVDYVTSAPHKLLARPQTTLVLSLAQLQKLAVQAKFTAAFTFGMGVLQLVTALHDFTTLHTTNLVVKHLDTILVAADGQVSTTNLTTDLNVWRVRTAATGAVWWLQHSGKPFEALTTAVATIATLG